MVKPQAEFRQNLKKSQEYVAVVNNWLRGYGFNSNILPYTVCKDVSERWEHTDSGDIEIRQRVEVKHRPKMDFKSLDDLPYPSIIIDEAYKIDKHNINTLYAYFIVNSSKTRAMVILPRTKKHWFKKKWTDVAEKIEREFYFCPKEHLILVKLT